MRQLNFYEKVLNHIFNYYGEYLDDELYLQMRYRVVFGKKLNLESPQSFYEKIQWLKLHDRKPLYHDMADKYMAREYIKDKVGEEYLVPLVGHWNNAISVNEDELPESFVIKCTHDSQSVRICKNKTEFDFDEMKSSFEKALKKDYSRYGREWAYRGIKPSVIAEELLTDESGVELKDYKFFCFNGEPRIIQVDYDRFVHHKRRIFDTSWNKIDVKITYDDDENKVIKRPEKFDEMMEISRTLSKNMAFLRVDLYYTDRIYVGELTFYPGGGFEPIVPYSCDLKWGEYLNLSNVGK